MTHARHRIAKATGAYAYFAEVEVSAAPDGAAPVVDAEVLAGHLSGFADAAVIGVTWALDVARSSQHVCVTDIRGIFTDTTPALVALCAAEATWSLVGFEPRAETRFAFDREVESTPTRDLEEPPTDVLARIMGSDVRSG